MRIKRERATMMMGWVLGLLVACEGGGTTGSDVGMTSTATSTVTDSVTESATSMATAMTQASATAPTSGADSTGTIPDECTCQVDEQQREMIGCGYEELAQWVPGCPADMPCGRVTVECMRPGQDLYDCMGQELVYDGEAIDCALGVLRDQVPARLEIDGTEDFGVFSGQQQYLVEVTGPSAVLSGCLRTDTGFFADEPSLVELADPSTFDACLALPTPVERYDCMWAALSTMGALPVCP